MANNTNHDSADAQAVGVLGKDGDEEDTWDNRRENPCGASESCSLPIPTEAAYWEEAEDVPDLLADDDEAAEDARNSEGDEEMGDLAMPDFLFEVSSLQHLFLVGEGGVVSEACTSCPWDARRGWFTCHWKLDVLD